MSGTTKEKLGYTMQRRQVFCTVINLLIEKGATVDALDNNSETALFEAIRSTIKDGEKQRAAIEALLAKGADPNVKNGKGLTPLQIAKTDAKGRCRKNRRVVAKI